MLSLIEPGPANFFVAPRTGSGPRRSNRSSLCLARADAAQRSDRDAGATDRSGWV